MKSRSSFLVLLALSQGAQHGYEIAAAIEERSKGLFSISFGALYPILHKFEAEGLVTAEWVDAGGTKSKKVYKLTAKGKAEVQSEIKTFKTMVSAFNGLIGGRARV